MKQDISNTNRTILESVVADYWESMTRFVTYLAYRMGVHRDAEDIAQDFWLRLIENAHKLTTIRCMSAWIRTVAVSTVLTAAARKKVLVHVSFEPETDVAAELERLGLTKTMKLLKKVRDPYGLPLYSGRIWPSKVEELAALPGVRHLEIAGLPCPDIQNFDSLQHPTSSGEVIELRSAFLIALESIQSNLAGQRADAFRLCDIERMSITAAARNLCLKPSTVNRYRSDVYKQLATDCPSLREYL